MITPFVRFAKNTSYLPNNFFVKAYDSRILYVLSGNGELRLSDKVYELKESTLVYYPAGTLYYPYSKSNLKFVTVNFDFTLEFENSKEVLSPVSESDFQEDLMRLCLPENETFKSSLCIQNAYSLKSDFLSLADEFESDLTYKYEVCSAILSKILYKIMSGITFQTNRIPLQIAQYIKENCQKSLSNTSIAEMFGYHPYYINSRFKKATGITLHRYIMKCRIEKSMEYLKTTSLSIEEIAYKTGFANQNHFSKKFGEYVKMTPTEYRKKKMFI